MGIKIKISILAGLASLVVGSFVYLRASEEMSLHSLTQDVDTNIRSVSELYLEPEKLIDHLTISNHIIGNELQEKDLDPYRETTRKDIESFIEEATPYIIKELGIEKFNVPNFGFVNDLGIKDGFNRHGQYKFFVNKIEIEDGTPVYFAKIITPSELTHAQIWALPPYKRLAYFMTGFLGFEDYGANPFNETFAEIVTLEVLANLALEGDLMAEYALLNRVLNDLQGLVMENKGIKLSREDYLYHNIPALILLDALKGENKKYYGVELDALVTKIKENVNEARPIYKKNH